ncbi:hypothetical protein ACQPZF_01375 [Actinosynnema sp. CS-041913]|uniref:hypothetical protein n=1 Tax=Actinosynnema sp. CS-041913 TaxID=3239917 RepID=UPI003D8B87F5
MSHPEVMKAYESCQELASAARQIGQENPATAVTTIDYRPEDVEAFITAARAALDQLDEAIDQEKAALAEQSGASEGSAADAARKEIEADLAELDEERRRLAALISEAETVEGKLDALVTAAAQKIMGVTGSPEVSAGVKLVLEGVLFDNPVAVEGIDAAEEIVSQAAIAVIKMCLEVQDEVDRMEQGLEAMMASSEPTAGSGSDSASAGGATSEGEASEGEASEGGADSPDTQTGEAQASEPGGGGQQGR